MKDFTKGYFANLFDDYKHINLLSSSNICFKLVLQDITEVIDILLINKNKEIKNVLNKLSHEIKTSCISISTILSSVNQKINRDETSDKYKSFIKKLEKISFFSDYMINTIHQINNYVDDFKSESSKFPIKLNLKQELGWAYLFTKSLLFNQNKFNVKVKLIIDDNAPEFISTERDKFRILLSEIIKNSVKHIFIGEITIMLCYIEKKTGKSTKNILNHSFYFEDNFENVISITISDTGTGIKEKDLMNIQEYLNDDIFFHNSVFAVTGSLRLGFTTMKHYADDIGAEIVVYSKEHKGTICNIKLNKKYITYGKSNSVEDKMKKSTKSLMTSLKMQPSSRLLVQSNMRENMSNKYNSLVNKTSSIKFISTADTALSFMIEKRNTLNLIAESIISPPSTAIQNGYYNTFSSTLLYNLNLNKINDEDYSKEMEEMMTSRKVNNKISLFEIKKKEDLINVKESVVQDYDNKDSDEEEEVEKDGENIKLIESLSVTQKQLSDNKEFDIENQSLNEKEKEMESLKIINFKFDEKESNKYSFDDSKKNPLPLLPLLKKNENKRNSVNLNLESSLALNILKISPLIARKSNERSYIIGVDDDFSCRKAMENLFNKIINDNNLDYNILILNDGLDLIEFIIRSIKENLSIRLIITDENMEFINGCNSLCLINNLYTFINKDFNLPSTFILTALEGNDIRQELKKKSNCIQVITKPINKLYMLECFYKAKILNNINI